jgi:hypothetical protein
MFRKEQQHTPVPYKVESEVATKCNVLAQKARIDSFLILEGTLRNRVVDNVVAKADALFKDEDEILYVQKI